MSNPDDGRPEDDITPLDDGSGEADAATDDDDSSVATDDGKDYHPDWGKLYGKIQKMTGYDLKGMFFLDRLPQPEKIDTYRREAEDNNTPNPEITTSWQIALGIELYHHGDYTEAIIATRKALQILSNLPIDDYNSNSLLEAKTLLGHILLRSGAIDEALEHLENVLEARIDRDDRPVLIAKAGHDVALALKAAGQVEEAIEKLQASIELCHCEFEQMILDEIQEIKKLSPARKISGAIATNPKTGKSRLKGELPKMLTRLSKARALVGLQLSSALSDLATMLAESGRLQEAEDFARQAASALDKVIGTCEAEYIALAVRANVEQVLTMAGEATQKNVINQLEATGFSRPDAQLLADRFAPITLIIEQRLRDLQPHLKDEFQKAFSQDISVIKGRILYRCLEVLLEKGTLPQEDEIPIEPTVHEWGQEYAKMIRSGLKKLLAVLERLPAFTPEMHQEEERDNRINSLNKE